MTIRTKDRIFGLIVLALVLMLTVATYKTAFDQGVKEAEWKCKQDHPAVQQAGLPNDEFAGLVLLAIGILIGYWIRQSIDTLWNIKTIDKLKKLAPFEREMIIDELKRDLESSGLFPAGHFSKSVPTVGVIAFFQFMNEYQKTHPPHQVGSKEWVDGLERYYYQRFP